MILIVTVAAISDSARRVVTSPVFRRLWGSRPSHGSTTGGDGGDGNRPAVTVRASESVSETESLRLTVRGSDSDSVQ